MYSAVVPQITFYWYGTGKKTKEKNCLTEIKIEQWKHRERKRKTYLSIIGFIANGKTWTDTWHIRIGQHQDLDLHRPDFQLAPLPDATTAPVPSVVVYKTKPTLSTTPHMYACMAAISARDDTATLQYCLLELVSADKTYLWGKVT